MYVVMLQDEEGGNWQFTKKKSYGDWYFVDLPQKATLYSRLRDAENRRKDVASTLARRGDDRRPKVQRVEFTGYELHDVGAGDNDG